MPKPPKPNNIFEKIKLADNEMTIVSPPALTPVAGESNPKKRLLHDISAAISKSEKAELLNRTVVKVNIAKKKALAGNKVSKLIGVKKHDLHTKTNISNQFEVALLARSQTTSLLKKIKKRIEADKSEPFDFDTLNKDIKMLYGHYQDKVILRDVSLKNKEATKSLQKTGAELKKSRSTKQRSSVEGGGQDRDIEKLERKKQDEEKLLKSSADDIKRYQSKVLEWQKKNPKPKSRFDQAAAFLTEPLMPSLNQVRQKLSASDRDEEHAEAAKKPDAHKIADDIRKGLGKNITGQHAQSNVAALDARASSHPKEVQSSGRGR